MVIIQGPPGGGPYAPLEPPNIPTPTTIPPPHPLTHPTGMFSFLFSPIELDGKDRGGDERALSPTPLLEDGRASGPNSSSSSSTVVLRSNTSAMGLKQLFKPAAAAAAMSTIADSETRTEASSDGEDASVGGLEREGDSGLLRKGKEPLLESVLNELNGDGKGLSALSPHRLMQVAKTIVLCCAYMAIGAWRWTADWLTPRLLYYRLLF